ncbi:hotdog fold thioesterase [Klebsiella quasipneumoniae subsp. quasipneumoniae]
MYEKDTCARTMGIELIEMDDGFAQMTMTVSLDMLNGHQTCHGGQLALLFDSGGGDQPVAGKRRAEKINAGRRSHRR